MISYISDNRVYEVLGMMKCCQPCQMDCCPSLASVSSDELNIIQSLGLIEQTEEGWALSQPSADYWISEYEEDHSFHKTAAAYWLLFGVVFLTLLVVLVK